MVFMYVKVTYTLIYNGNIKSPSINGGFLIAILIDAVDFWKYPHP